MTRRNAQPQTAQLHMADLQGLTPEEMLLVINGQSTADKLRAKKELESLVSQYGTIKVSMDRNLQIRTSPKTNRIYSLGSLIANHGLSLRFKTKEGIKIRKIKEGKEETLNGFEVDLGMSESVQMQIEAFRERDSAPVHEFTFVLGDVAEVTELLIDQIDPDQGKKSQLRVMVVGVLDMKRGFLPTMEMPEDEEDFYSFLEEKSKASYELQVTNREKARAEKAAMTNKLSEESIAEEIQAMEKLSA